MNTAYASSGISGLGDEAITLDDTTLAVAPNTLNDYTTGAVNAGTVGTLTGMALDMNTVYDNSNANTQLQSRYYKLRECHYIN